MTWQFLTLCSILAVSVSMLLQRLLMGNQSQRDPHAYAALFQGSVGGVTLLYALVQGFVWPDIARWWIPMLIACGLFAVGHILSAKALRIVDASVYVVLFATHSFWVMCFGVLFFHERLTWSELIGAGLIFGSVCLLADWRRATKYNHGILLGLLMGFLFGGAVSAWAYVGGVSDAASWTALSFAVPGLLILLVRPRTLGEMRAFGQVQTLRRMLLLAILYAIGSLTLLAAFNRGTVSVVAPLRSTSIVVTLLLAVTFLHERQNLGRKIVAALICTVGAMLML